jgi:hypothetical protein
MNPNISTINSAVLAGLGGIEFRDRRIDHQPGHVLTRSPADAEVSPVTV